MARSKHSAKKIAEERIAYLYLLAQEKVSEHPKDSRRFIEMMRNVATKNNIRLQEKKRSYCKTCNTFFVPGKNCRVRIHDQRRVISCEHCGTIKRIGY